MATTINLGWTDNGVTPRFDQGYKAGGRPVAPSTFTPLRLIDFDGLSDGQSVLGAGSVVGKRFDGALGDVAFAGGYGMRATTAQAAPGATSSCSLTIALGSDGDPAGGSTGVGYGAFGGTFTLGAEALSEGDEIWFGHLIKYETLWSWENGSGVASGAIKYLRFDNSDTPSRLDLQVVNGNDSHPANQSGWAIASEITPEFQSDTRKASSVKMPLNEWVWVESYLKASNDPTQNISRLWVNEQCVFERVGVNSRWINAAGVVETDITEGLNSLPSVTATITGVKLFTYWNGYAPKDNQCWLQKIAYHKNPADLTKTDQFGNLMMGTL